MSWLWKMNSFFVPDWQVPVNVKAVMTTRHGGYSTGSYSGFNLAVHVGDDESAVKRNRQQLMDLLTLPSPPLWLNQIHSDAVVNADAISSGQDADGIYTNSQAKVLCIQVADCLPILISDEDGTEVAAVHAGWRGLASGVIRNTVSLFKHKQLTAWIGPGIGPCHYEVDNKVTAAFANYEKHINAGRDAEHYQLNLDGIANDQLSEAGVKNISSCNECTYCSAEKYFSYRRDGDCGRMAALIWISRDSET